MLAAVRQAKFFDAGAILDQIQSETGRKRMEARKAAQAAGSRR